MMEEHRGKGCSVGIDGASKGASKGVSRPSNFGRWLSTISPIVSAASRVFGGMDLDTAGFVLLVAHGWRPSGHVPLAKLVQC